MQSSSSESEKSAEEDAEVPPEEFKQHRLLRYEQQIERDLTLTRRALLVLPRGFCVARVVANYLQRFRPTDPKYKASPFLIFLVNFGDEDFEAL
jgi:hypothetical protein